MKSGKKLGESSTTKAIKDLGFGVSSFKLVSKPVKKKVRGQRRRGEKGKKPGESSGKLVKYSFGIGGMT